MRHTSFRSLRHNGENNGSKKIFFGARSREQGEACFASGENLTYQLPKRHCGELEKLTQPGQGI